MALPTLFPLRPAPHAVLHERMLTSERATYTIDLDRVRARFEQWKRVLPMVEPFYGVCVCLHMRARSEPQLRPQRRADPVAARALLSLSSCAQP